MTAGGDEVTSAAFLTLARRRWHVVMVVVVGSLMVLLALVTVKHDPGVYTTDFQVVLLAPVDKVSPNSLHNPQQGLPALADVLVTEYNGRSPRSQTASTDATLYGQGIREGASVRLQNSGSQWAPSYDRPVIDVQVVDLSEAAVTARAATIRHRLTSLLRERQIEAGVRPDARVTISGWPLDPVVANVGGSFPRAALAILLVGFIVLATTVKALLKTTAGRRGRRQHDQTISTRRAFSSH